MKFISCEVAILFVWGSPITIREKAVRHRSGYLRLSVLRTVREKAASLPIPLPVDRYVFENQGKSGFRMQNANKNPSSAASSCFNVRVPTVVATLNLNITQY